MKNAASTALGVGTGILIGNGLAHLLAEPLGPNSENIATMTEGPPESPCQQNLTMFSQCLDANSKCISNCQFAYDALRQCYENRQF